MTTRFNNPAALGALARGEIRNALVAAEPGGIERQEKAGQMALVNSTDMPKEMSPSREAFEKVGFKFGDAVDELFLSAQLPPGWTRAATSHSMHSDILDEQGRKRVGIFYKAAFYDRRADARLVSRYKVTNFYGDLDDAPAGLGKDEECVSVTDAGKEIHRVGILKRSARYEAKDPLYAAGKEWLAERGLSLDDPTVGW